MTNRVAAADQLLVTVRSTLLGHHSGTRNEAAAMDHLFVVERYDDTGTPGQLQPLPVPPANVRLVSAVRIPVDDVVLALVEGTDEQSVSTALAAAGWRVDRITAATWAHPGEEVPTRDSPAPGALRDIP